MVNLLILDGALLSKDELYTRVNLSLILFRIQRQFYTVYIFVGKSLTVLTCRQKCYF